MKKPTVFGGTLSTLILCASLPAPAQSQGPGWALNFTAANGQYVEVPQDFALNPNQLTIEAWIRTENAATCRTIVSKGDGSNLNTDYIFQIGFNGATCGGMNISFFGAGAWDFSTNNVPTNTWTHVAVTANYRPGTDDTVKRFFINGVPCGAAIRSGSFVASATPFYIGRQGYFCNCNFFQGTIDEVRVWSTERTATELQQNMNRSLSGQEAGLLAYYRLDEGGGTTTADTTGHGHNGTFGSPPNNPAWITADEPLGAPSLTTLAATAVTNTSATLNGTIHPHAQPVLAWFQWGTTVSYGNNTPVLNLGSGNAAIATNAVLTNVSGGVTYHYRVAATNTGGVSYGQEVSFTTPTSAPTINNQAVTSITGTSAVLNASIRANGFNTTAWFEYGTSPSYGSATAITNIPGNTAGAVSVASLISGLSAGTTYHFRAAATNSLGSTFGPNQTFAPPMFVLAASLTGVFWSSVAWGDFDNDGLLDVAFSGMIGGGTTEIWRNTGNGFTNINAGLPGVDYGSLAWADFDNDGRLDLVFAGRFPSGPITQVWRNTGNGFTHYASLSGLSFCSIAVGDYDNDGRPDILISGGDSSPNPVTQLWHNNGSGFDYVGTGLPQLLSSSVAWGDYDNDGRLDILIAGYANNNRVTEVWRNTGSGFTNINAGLSGAAADGGVAWGDYDNDGRLDILLQGENASLLAISQVWRNTGSSFALTANLQGGIDGSVAWGDYDNDGWLDVLLTGNYSGARFTQVNRNTGGVIGYVDAGLTPVSGSEAAWGDYNNDGRLDVLLSGDGPGAYTQIWRNQMPTANSLPTAPSGLTAAASGSTVTLSWNAASDPETPALGLTYNIRVGTSPGGWDIVSPESNTTNGLRRLPKMGNAQNNLFATLNGLAVGRYYWSVQAIDSAFAGSPFAAEASFAIFPRPVITSFAHTNGQFQVRFNALSGGNYTLQASSNLVQWIDVTNVIIQANGNFQLEDAGAGNSLNGFYRVGVR